MWYDGSQTLSCGPHIVHEKIYVFVVFLLFLELCSVGYVPERSFYVLVLIRLIRLLSMFRLLFLVSSIYVPLDTFQHAPSMFWF